MSTYPKSPFKEQWQLDDKGNCPHQHTYEDRILLGFIPAKLVEGDVGYEVYQCPECGYVYLGIGIPLTYYLKKKTNIPT